MAEEYLQQAFLIKTMCDDLSRRLLRWHWEKQPGSHTLRSLGDYVSRRTMESPSYYERMPGINGKSTWQQLDTTYCMRVLLDGEENAQGTRLQLLKSAPKGPGAARGACNGVRIARNAAAHATSREGVAEAALAFRDAVDGVSDVYGGAAFTQGELEKYRQAAKTAIELCGKASAAKVKKASEPPRAAAPRSAPRKTAEQKTAGRKTAARKTPRRHAAGLSLRDAFFLLLAAAVLLAALYVRMRAQGGV